MTLYMLIGNFVACNTWTFWGVSGTENNKIFFKKLTFLFGKPDSVHKWFCVIFRAKEDSIFNKKL